MNATVVRPYASREEAEEELAEVGKKTGIIIPGNREASSIKTSSIYVLSLYVVFVLFGISRWVDHSWTCRVLSLVLSGSSSSQPMLTANGAHVALEERFSESRRLHRPHLQEIGGEEKCEKAPGM